MSRFLKYLIAFILLLSVSTLGYTAYFFYQNGSLNLTDLFSFSTEAPVTARISQTTLVGKVVSLPGSPDSDFCPDEHFIELAGGDSVLLDIPNGGSEDRKKMFSQFKYSKVSVTGKYYDVGDNCVVDDEPSCKCYSLIQVASVSDVKVIRDRKEIVKEENFSGEIVFFGDKEQCQMYSTCVYGLKTSDGIVYKLQGLEGIDTVLSEGDAVNIVGVLDQSFGVVSGSTIDVFEVSKL